MSECHECGSALPTDEYGIHLEEVAEIVLGDPDEDGFFRGKHVLVHVNCMPLDEIIYRQA